MNILRNTSLSRRLVLRGMGATMTLPFLEAMGAPKKKSGGNQLATGPDGQPIRYATVFMPNGAIPETFTPKGSTLEDLPETLPLGDMAEHCNVITGLSTAFGGHVASTAGFLTGGKPSPDKQSSILDIGGASVDQIIGKAAQGTCPLPTLELALHVPRRGTSPRGWAWAYGNFVSWKDATTPVLQEVNPMRAFLRLFEGVGVSAPSAKKRGFQPTPSVVDAVLDDAKKLQRRLGKADSQKLDEYLTSVSEVQNRILNQARAAQTGVEITEAMLEQIESAEKKIKGGIQKNKLTAQPKIEYPEYIQMMMDITALAFWSNSTRACTIMLGDGGSRRNMSFLDGVSGGHHSISHHGNKPEKLSQYKIINQFFVQQYTYFLKKLQSMEEGGSNVLENSMIFMGSGFGNGQVHSKSDIPMIMGGTAGGRIKTNRHIVAPRRTNVGALHRSVLKTMNVNGGDEIQGPGSLEL